VSSAATAADKRIVYTPITGDAAGSFVPNGWLIEGSNKGVRPWVTCTQVNN
jgi:hypothetical protein